jgi:hypothetical protein
LLGKIKDLRGNIYRRIEIFKMKFLPYVEGRLTAKTIR